MDHKGKLPPFSYALIVLWGILIAQTFFVRSLRPADLSYSEFKAAVASHRVEEVSISPTMIHGRMKEGADTPAASDSAHTNLPSFDVVRVDDPRLLRDLTANHIKVIGVVENTFWRDLFSWVVPIVLLGGLWLAFLP